MTRICITGGPLTGKTTLAGALVAEMPVSSGVQIRHTDDLIPLGWSEASAAAALWFDAPGPWIVEGVAVPRALRKWRKAHPDERPPVDRLIYLTEPYQVCMAGQSSMARGIETVMREIAPWLRQHGVVIEFPRSKPQVAHQERARMIDPA